MSDPNVPESCWLGDLMLAQAAHDAEAEFLRDHALDREWRAAGRDRASQRSLYWAPRRPWRAIVASWAGSLACAAVTLALFWPLVGWAFPASFGNVTGAIGSAYAISGFVALLAPIRWGDDRWRESAV